MTTAILIDGGFYRKRASKLFGIKTAEERATEIYNYAIAHCKRKDNNGEARRLYRIFYYDCPPISGTVFNPVTGENLDLGKSATSKWTDALFSELSRKRKVALRLGTLSKPYGYSLKPDALKKIMSGKWTKDDIHEEDLSINISQKGVDMKIGIDILHLSYRRLVDQIILISGDSDFVPAAKTARKEGIDFILDPMGLNVTDSLLTHIDGCQSSIKLFMPPVPTPPPTPTPTVE